LKNSGSRRARLHTAAERLRYFVLRRRGEIKRRLKWLPLVTAVASAVVAGVLAPRVDTSDPAANLQAFFGIALGVILAIFLGLGLVQLALPARPERVLRYLGRRTFVVLVLGMAAAGGGLITSLDSTAYRYLFAITIGSCMHGLVTMLLVVTVSVAEQRSAARAALAASFGKPSDTDDGR
jgi:fucose 4-O-acetylase-like acetyltransferase